ncbi:MAG: hypothetical protein LBR25_00480 [Erysipelotrichaceae bacterium]|jgi:hypothetical protein|nr:hypothetical protein [Erysipelotrichaceae bacterium]
MKRLLLALLSGLLIALSLSGCAKKTDAGSSGAADSSGSSGAVQTPVITEKLSPSDSYSAFNEGKALPLDRIINAFYETEDMWGIGMTLSNVYWADLTMISLAFFTGDEATTKSALAMLGLGDADYSQSGNTYTLKYDSDDGIKYVDTAVYDATKDFMVFEQLADGAVTIHTEYYRTATGYIAVYNSASSEGGYLVYKIYADGQDGSVGIEQSDSVVTLKGNETKDFATSSPQWYKVEGDLVTGIDSNGNPIELSAIIESE